jgi:hypothetical protein
VRCAASNVIHSSFFSVAVRTSPSTMDAVK